MERLKQKRYGNRLVKENLMAIEDDELFSSTEITSIASNYQLLRRYREKYDNKLYSTLMFSLIHEKYPEKEAKHIWRLILTHRNKLNKKLDRDVGITVAALDYLTNIRDTLASPRIIDERRTQAIAEVATRDDLTKLYLRSIFDVVLKKQFLEAKRQQSSLAVMMIDIDNFKRINDTYGHLKGDLVLRKVAQLLERGIRESDLAARFGGEEMAVVLPNTTLKDAADIAERIRSKIEHHFCEDLRVTVSIGVGDYGEERTATAEELLHVADQALYRAKNAGKNRVVQAVSNQ